jgi:apolipoprotein N-acyltransferase
MFVAAPTHGMGAVAFIGLIPLLVGVRQLSSYRSAATGGILAGLAFFLPGLAWLIPVTVVGWIALSIYCAVYFAAFAAAVYWSSRLTATWNALFLAATWTLLEFVRGIAFTGFPWLLSLPLPVRILQPRSIPRYFGGAWIERHHRGIQCSSL